MAADRPPVLWRVVIYAGAAAQGLWIGLPVTTKLAVDAVAICVKSGGWTLRVGEDTTHSTLYAGAVVRGNTFIARNGADIYYWGPDAEETGETSICDQNTLILQGSGKYGDVKDTADCATLAAVRTAWSDYDVTTNDSQSADGDVAFYSALGAAAGAGRLSVSI